MNIHRLCSWIKEIWNWLTEGRIVFMGLFVIASAVVLGFITWHSETSIRLSGYILQIIGILITIRGLLRIRAHFNQIPLRKLLVNWIMRFPKRKRHVVFVTGGGHLKINGQKARFYIWSLDNQDDPIEKRINNIVKNIERLRDGQREHSNSIDRLSRSHDEHKKDVKKQTEKLEDRIRSEQESLLTDDSITSLVGLILLIVGITMSTWAQEFYQWLN